MHQKQYPFEFSILYFSQLLSTKLIKNKKDCRSSPKNLTFTFYYIIILNIAD